MRRKVRRRRKQVLARAEAQNIPIPVSKSGWEPTVVTYTNGRKVPYIKSLERYAANSYLARNGVRLSPGQEPPRTIDEWGLGELERWLEEHPSD